MPLGAMVMGLMIGGELRPKYILDEVHVGQKKLGFFDLFYKICITVVAPVVMALVLSGQIGSFFTKVDGSNAASVSTISYIVSFGLLVIFALVAYIGPKKTVKT